MYRLPVAGFLAMCLLGGCGVALADLITPDDFAQGVLIANVLFILSGAFLVGFGIRALLSPTTLRLVDNAGTDASGAAVWVNERGATREQGVRAGVISLAIGVPLVVVGCLAGALARGLGFPTH